MAVVSHSISSSLFPLFLSLLSLSSFTHLPTRLPASSSNSGIHRSGSQICLSIFLPGEEPTPFRHPMHPPQPRCSSCLFLSVAVSNVGVLQTLVSEAIHFILMIHAPDLTTTSSFAMWKMRSPLPTNPFSLGVLHWKISSMSSIDPLPLVLVVSPLVQVAFSTTPTIFGHFQFFLSSGDGVFSKAFPLRVSLPKFGFANCDLDAALLEMGFLFFGTSG